MALIQNVVTKIVKLVTPENGKIITNTSSAGMAGALNTSNLNKITQFINQAIDSSFPGDEFSSTIAKLNALRSMKVHAAQIFASSFGDDLNTQEKVIAAYESLEDIATIQSSPDFARHIKPYAEQAQQTLALEKLYIEQLEQSLEHRVLPVADLSSWLAVVGKLRRLPKKRDKLEESLIAMFDGYDLGDKFVDKFIEVRNILENVFTKEFTAELKLEYTLKTSTSPQDEKNIIAASGTLTEIIPWLTVLNRCERNSNEAVGLTGYHAAAELSTSNPFLLDFSASHAFEVNPKDDLDTPAEVAGTELITTLMEGEEPAEHDFDLLNHEKALAYHILAFAETGIYHVKSSKTSPIVDIQPNSLVNIDLHVIYPYFKKTLSNTWKCFMPDNAPMNFFKSLAGYVRGHRAQQYMLRNVRPTLESALIADLESIVEETRVLAITGRKLDAANAVSHARQKLVEYDVKLVTPFDDQKIHIDTDVTSFSKNGIISATTIRPVGMLECPVSNSYGFSEFALVKDKRKFDAVTSSSKTGSVGKVYNAVTDINSASAYAVTETVKVSNYITAAVNDVLNGVLRKPISGVGPVKASEYVADANFVPISGDFYIQNINKQTQAILVQAGLGHVMVDMTTIGNFHGAFAFGEMKGQNANFALDFSTSVNEAMRITITDLFESYGVRKWKCDTKLDVDVSLDETNRPYDKRLMALAENFDQMEINVNSLISIASSPLLVEGLQKRITPELLSDLRHGELHVRTDMNNILVLLASNLYEQLVSAHSTPVLNMLFKGITATLDISDIQTLKNKSMIDAVNGASNTIAKSMETVDSLTFIIFINALIKAHNDKLVVNELTGV